MYVMRMQDFLKLTIMKPHNELLHDGVVFPWGSCDAPVNFLSHQWLGIHHPDPHGEQLRCMQAIFQTVVGGELPFKSEKDWELYSKRANYMKAKEKSFGAVLTGGIDQEELLTKEMFVQEVAEGLVWLDYRTPAYRRCWSPELRTTRLRRQQQQAVNSIPAYVDAATTLWVMAPCCTHVDWEVECNYASWARRGWYRVEDWVNEFSLTPHRSIIVEGLDNVWVEDLSVKLTSRAQRQHSALNGEFTCCRVNHEVNGRPIMCDKQRVRQVIRSSLDRKVQGLKSRAKLETWRSPWT
eukprot:TRINITY_DN23263_c0_g2_i1.p1 TRINITY_DN23263_c0_g2~~TRINITY_DN23263_c0_g2_i1.p1  ORF type:complete len:295 (-),score=31.26 TRINITY_DN23263_c0_g2_i1:376-1260(-)